MREHGPSFVIDFVGGFEISRPSVGVLPFFLEGLTQYFSKTLSVNQRCRDCSNEAFRTRDSDMLWKSLSDKEAAS